MLKSPALFSTIVAVSLLALESVAQQPKAKPEASTKTAAVKGSAPVTGKSFVLDVVQSAVSLPQPDQQDRLRVLNSAIQVVAPINRQLARKYAREGARIEAELIAVGQTPAVSVMANGDVDCSTATDFVNHVRPEALLTAEQSLIGAVTACPKETSEPVKMRIDAAMQKGIVAPRLTMAMIERMGATSPWSQQKFVELFANLPSDSEVARREAPNFAAMYAETAEKMDKDAAKKAGLELLGWLGKLDESGNKNLAINIANDGMKKALGEQSYNDALASDVLAAQAARQAGQPGELDQPEEESASVLQAMGNTESDQTSALNEMPPSKRAREAAALGFATGTSGKKQAASHYFDIAFSAADEAWSERTPEKNAPAIVEEVSEAAAQVDPVNALQRAQAMQDPTAQAIGMLAVARTVMGQTAQQ